MEGDDMVKKILVPVDGSKTSLKAATFAVDLARQLGASIIALSVIDKRLFMGGTTVPSKVAKEMVEPVEDYLKEVTEEYLEDVRKLCQKNKVTFRTLTKMGYPVAEIIKEAKRAEADMIVMGSHGRSALSATVLGSVSYGVIHHDKSVPVLIVRD
jgi:nucleotide-binding universal stress UspA family protein